MMHVDVPTIGAILDDRYEVVRVLGEGANGIVLEARRLGDGTRVAVKLLDSTHGDPQRAERLEREARVLARIDHPGIVRLLEVGRFAGGSLYVAIELVEGLSLAEVLRREGALSPVEAKRLMLQVARALGAAHAAGVVHRDLHPGNVMLTGKAPERDAKLVDFGVSALANDSKLTPPGAAPGTVAYMAPEQLRGEATPQSDLYAWGLVLLECLVGRRTITGRSFYEIAFKQLRDDAVPIPTDLLAHPLGVLLERAVTKKLAARLSSADALSVELEAIDVSDLLLAGSDETPAALRSRLAKRAGVEASPRLTRATPPSCRVERRPVTLVVVESGEASSEPLRARLLDVVAAFEGLVHDDGRGPAQLLFGLPSAHPEDALHAVSAAFALALAPLLAREAEAAPVVLRCGVASGLLVVDPDAPVASRFVPRDAAVHERAFELSRAALAGTVLVDSLTERLVRSRFECEPAAQADLGCADRIAHRVVRARTAPSGVPATPMLGRDREHAALLRLWSDACAGKSRAAFVVGEAGIGKSRLVQAIGESAREAGGRWVDCAGWQPLELLSSLLATPTDTGPTLITLDDAERSDPALLDLLAAALARPDARLLIVLAAPAELTLPGALASPYEVALARLPADAIAAIARASALPESLANDAVEHVVVMADGMPLHAEEIARSLVRAVELAPSEPVPIPPTLRGRLTARLDAAGNAKRTARLAALAGRDARYGLLAAVAPWGEATLDADLEVLLASGLIYQRGVPPVASYQFVHPLLRAAARESMVPETRRAWHAALAAALVAQSESDVAAGPDVVAHHFADAGLPLDAARWAERAGRRSLDRSAPAEATRFLRFALDQLAVAAASPERDAIESSVQRDLATALTATEGMASVGVELALKRARALYAECGDERQVLVLDGDLGKQQIARAHFSEALVDADHALRGGAFGADAFLEASALVQRGIALFFVGRLVEARVDLDRAVARLDPPGQVHAARRAVESLVLARCFLARVLWHLGLPDQALVVAAQNLDRAQRTAPLHTELEAHNVLMAIHLLRRDAVAVEQALEAIEARGTAVLWPALEAFLVIARVWAVAQRGENLTSTMDVSIALFQATGMKYGASFLHVLAADACLAVGEVECGLSAAKRGLAVVAETTEYYLEPELHRLHAALLDARDGPGGDAARDALELAFSIADSSGARSFALRIASDLARWHLVHADRASARAVLAPELAAVVEGESTMDVLDARTIGVLLDDAR